MQAESVISTSVCSLPASELCVESGAEGVECETANRLPAVCCTTFAPATFGACLSQGNVRLTNVRITGQPSCLKDVIEPAGEYTCNTTLASTQAQFEAAQMVVTFAAEALPRCRWV